LNERLQHDQEFKQGLKEVRELISRLTEHFELPLDNQTNLTLEIYHAVSFFAENAQTIQPKMVILYPPRDYYLVKLYK